MLRGNMKPQEFSSKVSEALRGEPGTSFVLKVLRPLKNDSTVMEFKITRKNIRNNPVPYYGIIKDSIIEMYFCIRRMMYGLLYFLIHLI